MSPTSSADSSREARKYWAFISYRHADNKDQGRQWATWMHQAIETYDIPSDLVGKENNRNEKIPERIYPIFRDEEELAADADLAGSITRALDNSQYLVVICSPRAVESTYVAEEIKHFKRTKSDRVLPMIIDGKPEAHGDVNNQQAESEGCFPEPLRYKIDPDGSVSDVLDEPIAADFRLNNTSPHPEQGWTSPEAYRQDLIERGEDEANLKQLVAKYRKQLEDNKLQVIAGILGLPLGELTRRDKAYQLELAQRRARVLRRWVTALAVLAVLVIAGGVVALIQRKIAIRERDESEARRLAAVSEANAAEQTDLAHLLALESLRISETQEGWAALLKSLSRPVLARTPMTEHTESVNHVVFSPVDPLLASASNDRSIVLWDVGTRRKIAKLDGHKAGIEGLAFSPCGKFLASGDDNGTVLLWDVASRKRKGNTMTNDKGPISDLAFSPDSRSLASADFDGWVRVWDVDSQEKKWQQRGNERQDPQKIVLAVAFAYPDGSRLASACADGTVRIWSRTGERVTEPMTGAEGKTRWEQGIAFTPDLSLLAVALPDSSIRLWNVESANGSEVGALIGHDERVWSLDFKADPEHGLRLASACLDKTVRLWDVTTKRPIGGAMTGHDEAVFGVAFSPDGSMVASGSSDKTVRLWELGASSRVGKLLTGHKEMAAVAMSADGSLAASAGGENENRSVQLWNLETGRRMGKPLRSEKMVQALAFSPNKSHLAMGDVNGVTHLWALPGGSRSGALAATRLEPPLTGHVTVMDLAFNARGSRLATAGLAGNLCLWDVDSRVQVGQTVHAHEGPVLGLAFSTDGSHLVSGGVDKIVKLWRVTATGVEPLKSFAGHDEFVWDVAFNSDNTRLLSIGMDGIRQWQVATGRQHGEVLVPPQDRAAWVQTAAFSPDGRMAVTYDADGAIHVRDVASGQPMGEPLYGHTRYVAGFAFSRDAMLLASVSRDMLRLWPAQTRWPTLAHEAADRNLMEEEWKRLIDPDPQTYQRHPEQREGMRSLKRTWPTQHGN